VWEREGVAIEGLASEQDYGSRAWAITPSVHSRIMPCIRMADIHTWVRVRTSRRYDEH
jgi:hypothetical protein